MKQYQAKIVLNKYEGIHSKRNPAAPKCDKERPNSLRQSLRFEGPILGPFRRRVNFGHEFRNIMRWCICTSSSAPAVVGKKKVSITKQCWHAPLCYTSLIIYFKSNSRTTSRTCTVPSISSNSAWVYIQYTYLSICTIHHDSACLNEDLLGSH